MSSAGVEDEEILDVLRSADEPRLTTTEVAEALPITRGRTRTRLQRLTDDGRLERETVGNEVVWWLAERDEQGEDQATERAADEDGTGDETSAAAGEESPAGEEASEQPADDATEGPAGAEGAEGDAASVETPEVDEEAEPVAAEAEATGETGDGTGGTEEGTGGAPDEGPAEIEVEAVGDQVTTRGSVTEADEAPPERPTPGEDGEERTGDEGAVRALGLLAAAVVVVVLLRRLLAGDGDR